MYEESESKVRIYRVLIKRKEADDETGGVLIGLGFRTPEPEKCCKMMLPPKGHIFYGYKKFQRIPLKF